MNTIDSLLEVVLKEDEDFLKIKETLTRIGVASKKEKTLYQSCHILHKRGKYYITHFKELFLLDGKKSEFSEEDKGRRNTIANLLEEWGLLTIPGDNHLDLTVPLSQIKVLSFKEKNEWMLESKYTVGKKKY
jgi:hypothetical protein